MNSFNLLIVRWISVLFLIMFSSLIAAQPVVTKTNEGTDFWLTFPPNLSSSYSDAQLVDQLSFVIAARLPSTVNVIATPPKGKGLLVFSEQITLTAGEQRIVRLPKEFARESNLTADDKWQFDEDHVRITATSPISVYGRNLLQYTTDGFLALPTATLGKDYVVAAYTPLAAANLKIVATENNTNVIIRPTENSRDANGQLVAANTERTVQLQKGQTLYISALSDATSARKGDPTGTTISADKSVGVFSGVRCTFVPIDKSACDHLVEMMPPTTALGSSFLLVPAKRPVIGDRIRVIAAVDETAIYRDRVVIKVLARGEWFEFAIDTPERLEVSRPALVVQYLQGQGASGNGDPAMMLVVPTPQFLTTYQVSTFQSPPVPPNTIDSVRIRDNFINVVIPTSGIASIKLDNVAVAAAEFFPIPQSAYSYARLPIELGAHSVEAAVPFGLYSYGLGTFESYAYPGGMAINAINDPTDPFPPNARIVQVGQELQGLATDSSDVNANGILDPEELMWGTVIGPRAEDTNRNSAVDPGEDLNGNGRLDRDLGLAKIELAPGALNLTLEVAPFTPGALAVPFTVRKIDPAKDGIGAVVVTDLSGNKKEIGASLSNGLVIRNVRVLEIVSKQDIVLDIDSFVTPPTALRSLEDRYEIEWRYPQTSSLTDLNLGYDVTFKLPVANEDRVISRRTLLQYDDSSGNQVNYEIGPKGVHVLDTQLEIGASLDKTVYLQGERGQLSATVTNLGLTPSYGGPCARVLDAQGNVVELFITNSFSRKEFYFSAYNVPAGQTKPANPNPMEMRFNTLLVGSYTVEVMLLKEYAQSCSPQEALRKVAIPFSVSAAPDEVTVNSGLQLDRATYRPSDRVLANTLVRNLMSRGIANGYSMRVQIMRPDGTMLTPITKAVPQLVPLNQWPSDFSFALRNEPSGIYTAISQLLDDRGGVVDTRNAKFNVLSTASTGFGLTGTIDATPEQVRAGETLTLTASATNQGNAALTGVPLTVYLIDPDLGVVIKQFDQTSTIAQGATVPFNSTWTVQGTPNKTYLAILAATIGSGVDATSLTLAQDTFQILPQIPATIIASAGTPQTRALGQSYTAAIEATVRDTASNPVEGAVVTFTSPASGASVAFTSGTAGSTANVVTAITNSAGKASVTVSANTTAGSFQVVATTTGVTGAANFALQNVVPITNTLSISSGTPQSATITQAYGQPLKALVQNSQNQPVAGVTVTFTAPASGASVSFPSGNSAVTDTQGIATINVNANGIAGAMSVVASAPGVNGTADFALTNLAPVAASLTIVSGTPQTATITQSYVQTLQAVVRNNLGQTMTGVEVVFTAPASGASVTFVGGNRIATDASGIAKAAVIANATAGSFSVVATTAGASGSATFNLQNVAPVATSITAVAGTPQSVLVTKDYTTPIRALVKDNLNNPMAGVVVTFTPPTGSAVASVTFPSGSTAVTGVDGQASVSVRANTVSGAFTVNATVPNVATPAAFSLTNTPPVPTTITATCGTPQSATVTTNYAAALEATVRDTLGNPSGGVLVTFSAPPAAGAATVTFPSGNTATTDGQGKARVTVTANAVTGALSVTAATNGVSGTGTFSLTNLAPTTASITATAGTPQSALVGKDFATALQATVKDSLGNPVSGASVTFTAPTAGASATFSPGATANTNAQGQASVAVRANAIAGSFQVTATTNGVTGNAAFALTNSPAVATTISATAGTPQSTTITTQYAQQIEATVLDTLGNASAGVLVTFAAPTTAGSATVTFPAGNTGTTDAQGKARVAVKANDTAGAVTVIATATNVAGDARFNLTNIAPTVANIITVSGTPQTARSGTPFTQALVATVRDSLGAPVNGVLVTFAAPTAGASVTFPSGNTATTNAAGQASLTVQANANVGVFNVTATALGATGNASFALTITAACQPANGVVFTAVTGAGLNSVVTSNTVTVTGLGVGCTAAASIAGGAYKIERGGKVLTTKASVGFSTAPQALQDGDQITLEQTTSAQNGVATTATLALDSVPYAWSATTAAAGQPVVAATPVPLLPETEPWRSLVLTLLALMFVASAARAFAFVKRREVTHQHARTGK
jgi:hypothetical protein